MAGSMPSHLQNFLKDHGYSPEFEDHHKNLLQFSGQLSNTNQKKETFGIVMNSENQTKQEDTSPALLPGLSNRLTSPAQVNMLNTNQNQRPQKLDAHFQTNQKSNDNPENYTSNGSNFTMLKGKFSKESSGYKVRSSVGQGSIMQQKYLQELNVGSMSPASAENQTRFCSQVLRSKPLFQLSIQIPNCPKPELIKFHDGQDPFHVALNLHYKYPHVIDRNHGLLIVEQKIKDQLNAAMLKRNMKLKENDPGQNDFLNHDIHINEHDIAVDVQDAVPVLTETDRTDPCIDRNEENVAMNCQISQKEAYTSQTSQRKTPQMSQFSPGLSKIDQKQVKQQQYQCNPYMNGIPKNLPIYESQLEPGRYVPRPLILSSQLSRQTHSINNSEVYEKKKYKSQVYLLPQPSSASSIAPTQLIRCSSALSQPVLGSNALPSPILRAVGRSRERTPEVPGTRLYLQARQMRERLDRMREEHKREREERESEELWQSSVRNKYKTRGLELSRRHNGKINRKEKVEDELLQKHKRTQEKIQQMKKEMEEELLIECNNFQPTINHKSRVMDRQKIMQNVFDPDNRYHFRSVEPTTFNHNSSTQARSAANKSTIIIKNNEAENIDSDEEQMDDSAQIVNQSLLIQQPFSRPDNFQDPANDYESLNDESMNIKQLIKRQFKEELLPNQFRNLEQVHEQPIKPNMNMPQFLKGQLSAIQEISSVSAKDQSPQPKENKRVAAFKIVDANSQQHPKFNKHQKKEVDYEELPSVDSRADLDQLEPKIMQNQRMQKEESEPQNVNSYLYNLGQAMLKKKKLMSQLIIQQKQYQLARSRTVSASKKSHVIHEKRLQEQLSLIFKKLDSENNGCINPNKIDLEQLPADILLVFKPLLLEMDNFNEELDETEFIESSLILLQSCTINDRNAILNFGKKKKKANDYSFTPEINQNSSRIAQQIHQRMKRDMQMKLVNPHERFEIHRELANQKRTQLMNKMKKKEQSVCTFRPAINRFNKAILQNALDVRYPRTSRTSRYHMFGSASRSSNSSRSSPYNTQRGLRPVLHQQHGPRSLKQHLPLNLNLALPNMAFQSARLPSTANSVVSTARMPILTGRELPQIPEHAEPDLQASIELSRKQTGFSSSKRTPKHQVTVYDEYEDEINSGTKEKRKQSESQQLQQEMTTKGDVDTFRIKLMEADELYGSFQQKSEAKQSDHQADANGGTGSFGSQAVNQNMKDPQIQIPRINLRYRESADVLANRHNQAFELSENNEENRRKQSLQERQHQDTEVINNSIPSIQYDKSIVKSKQEQADTTSQNMDTQRKSRKGRKERKRRSLPAKGNIVVKETRTNNQMTELNTESEQNKEVMINFGNLQKQNAQGDRNIASVHEGNAASQFELYRKTINSSQSNLQSMITEHLIARNPQFQFDHRTKSMEHGRARRENNSKRRGESKIGKGLIHLQSGDKVDSRKQVTYDQENMICNIKSKPDSQHMNSVNKHSPSVKSLASSTPCDVPQTFNIDMIDAKARAYPQRLQFTNESSRQHSIGK